MRCHECPDPIETGEAMTQEPVPGCPHRFWFFHPGCHAVYKEKQVHEHQRLEHATHLARTIH